MFFMINKIDKTTVLLKVNMNSEMLTWKDFRQAVH